jgi:hypothetical protein
MTGLVLRRPLGQRHVLSDARIETFLKQPVIETVQQPLTF